MSQAKRFSATIAEWAKRVRDFLIDEKGLHPAWRKLLSLLLLAAAGSIALVPFEKCLVIWWCDEVYYLPGFLSGLLAIGMVMPMYARGILIWAFNVYRLLSFALVLFVSGVAIEIALLGGNSDGWAGFIGSFTGTMLFVALLLSWLGMREVAGYVWLLVLIPIAHNLMTSDNALGFYGFIFVVCGFLGLMLQSENSFENTLTALGNEYSRMKG